jgi:tetratricopeptide (TPR) repeat protein
MSESSSTIPQSAEDYLRLGWVDHGKANETAAEEEFQRAIQLSPALIDAYFGLALALKAQGRKQESIKIFQKVIELLDKDLSIDKTRHAVLRRLTHGHINQLESGDWGLEKEVWKHTR